MKILGISDSHNSSACLLEDGKVISACEEERFTRVKAENGFPVNAIKVLLKEYNLIKEEIDYVAVSPVSFDYISLKSKRYQRFGVKEFLFEQEMFWKPTLLNNARLNYLEVMKEHIEEVKDFYPLHNINFTIDQKEATIMRVKSISECLNINPDRIIFVDHHTCHAFHSYFSSPLREDCLILTADSSGDGINATVNTIKNGNYENIFRTSRCNIGRIYRLITLLLRMRPHHDEYKVMGLAAYAKEYAIKGPYSVFKDTLYVDGLEFKYYKEIKDHYEYFAERLEPYRFDAIAGALQKYVEELLVQWVKNAINISGIENIVFGGGVALNIKAMQAISELPEVNNLFICAGAGDESLSIGAAQRVYYDKKSKNGINKLKPLNNAYLGSTFKGNDIKEALEHPFIKRFYDITQNVSDLEVAKIISEGDPVGIMFGSMEFGPRALGHRSIIADPRNCDIVRKINEAIKNRDFWMPFAPSVLFERVSDYLINPKGLIAPYMTITFKVTDLGRKELAAAIHPYDFTTRPQMVTKEANGRYYDIIKAFEKLTGVGAVLNTSFNIHGKPIVLKPIDVVNEILTDETVVMKYILFDTILLSRKS